MIQTIHRLTSTMKSKFLLLSLLVMQMGTAFSQSAYKFKSVPSFEDNFDTFNKSKWGALKEDRRTEFQYYTDHKDNLYVKDGVIHLKPTLTIDRFNDSNDPLYHGKLKKEGCNDHTQDTCLRVGNDTIDIMHPIQSARLHSKYSFTYGKMEVRAKMPSGDWLYSSIWLQSFLRKYPSSPLGEIDVAQTIGNEEFYCGNDNKQKGSHSFGSAMHWGQENMSGAEKFHPYTSSKSGKTSWETDANVSLSEDFHVFGIERTPDKISFLLDGKEVQWMRPPAGGFQQLYKLVRPNVTLYDNAVNLRMAPFDQPLYIILNVAAGGGGFSARCKNGKNGIGGRRPWNTSLPLERKQFWDARAEWLPTWDNCKTDKPAMKVDWVRVYELDTN